MYADDRYSRPPEEFMSTVDSSAARQSRHRMMLVTVCGVVVLAGLLRVRSDQQVELRGLSGYPLPETCWSRRLFHVTCPGCGLTRSLIYLAHGDWRASLATHRLGIVMAVAILAQFPYCAVGILWKKDYPLGRRFAVIVAWTLIILLFANWLFDVLVLAR
jgi:hypothetical protein